MLLYALKELLGINVKITLKGFCLPCSTKSIPPKKENMKDLYKRSNFPTRVDIFGEECFVSRVEYDEKFDIEILFGRPVSKTMGAKRVILTPEFVKFILDTWKVPSREFNSTLKFCSVNAARRKVKSNPYKSYNEWVKSRDTEKPKEIRLLNIKDNPEYIEDYLGTKHIVLSAKMTDEGLVFPLGVPVHIYKAKDKKTKRYILTSTLVDLIKEYRYHPSKGIHRFPFGLQTFMALKKELGIPKSEMDDINLWLSAHLEKILTMTNQEFYDQYAAKALISKTTITAIKTSCRHIKRMASSKEKKEKQILELLKLHVKSQNKDKVLQEKLCKLMGQSKYLGRARAARLLILAKKNNHKLPVGYKRLI